MQKTKRNFSHFIYSNKRSSKYLFYEQSAQTGQGENCFVPKNMKNWMCVSYPELRPKLLAAAAAAAAAATAAEPQPQAFSEKWKFQN